MSRSSPHGAPRSPIFAAASCGYLVRVGQNGLVFEGFDETWPAVGGGVRLHERSGGVGPAVVLLHGHRRTQATWYRVAPLLLTAGYTVVCPDLRGYGQSSKPATKPDHGKYTKRAMAGDILALMRQLGHERFAVVGHDRGSCVATRLALDAPAAVTHLAVLDGVPIGEALARTDARFARSLVAVVLLRPTRQARAGDPGRPGCLVWR